VAGEIGCGIHRIRQREQGQGHVCVPRRRDRATPGGRAIEADIWYRDDARALSGRCSRARGYHGRAGRPADRRQRDARADPERPSSRTCGDHPEAESIGAGASTVAEAGVPDFDVTGWFAFFVPARTSREIVEKIHIDTVTALSDPTVKAKLENVGMVAIGSTPEELAVLLKVETDKWSAVIKEANIALD